MTETISPDTVIGQYRVISKIGEGGMGEVYRARDTKLGRDGKELYFMTPERMLMAVEVKPGATFEMGTPKPLFPTSVSSFSSPNRYDVSADGQRFLVNSAINETSRTPLVVIVNWAAGLKKQ